MQVEHDHDHDQSTVNSPTREHFHEKVTPQEGYGTGAGAAPAKTTGFVGILDRIGANPIIRYGLRALQFIFAIITLALASRSLNKFWTGEQRMRYTIFCGSITLLYLVIVILLGFLAPTFLIAGALLLTEVILCVFWLASFIAVASRYSGYSCSRSDYYGGYSGGGYGSDITQYASSSRISGCRSGKAAAAFAAFSFLFFLLSSLLLFFNVIRRMRTRNTTPGYLFRTGDKTGIRMSREGLAYSYDRTADEEARIGTGAYNGSDNATYVDPATDNQTGGAYNQQTGGTYNQQTGGTYNQQTSGYDQQTTDYNTKAVGTAANTSATVPDNTTGTIPGTTGSANEGYYDTTAAVAGTQQSTGANLQKPAGSYQR